MFELAKEGQHHLVALFYQRLGEASGLFSTADHDDVATIRGNLVAREMDPGRQAWRQGIFGREGGARERIGVGNGVGLEGSLEGIHDNGAALVANSHDLRLIPHVESEPPGGVGRHNGVGTLEHEHPLQAGSLGFGSQAQTGGRATDDDQIEALGDADHAATLVGCR